MPAPTIRDPYYRSIVEGLDRHVDPEVFEDVAVELLRRIHPGIAALLGGKDSGRDGLIPDGDEEPYPLIVTTGDPLRNLSANLDSYAKDPSHRNRAVLATSRALTPAKVKNLFERAREKGFSLLNVYQQRDFAAWLYRDPESCQRLLGLTGKPAVLAALPESRRAHQDFRLIGREKELAWLRDTVGDRLLVGQPGIGKTALLRQLVREGRGLFLVDDDAAEVANELRAKYDGGGPTLVLVDDAHSHPQRLALLRRLRDHPVEARFDIVATTWPSEGASVREEMGPAVATKRVELLGRDELVALYNDMGIAGPARLVQELVDQAANKPGLAMTLASLWLQGDHLEKTEVLTGEALAKHVTVLLRRHLGFDPTWILATIALAGWRGIEPELVAVFLQSPRDEVAGRLSKLGHAGVLSDVGGRRLRVEPARLRPVLVRDVFLPAIGAAMLPYGPLLEGLADDRALAEMLGRASDRGAAVESLVAATGIGGRIPREELRQLVTAYGSPVAWRGLASIDHEHATWVLDHFPGEVEAIASSTLGTAPEATIQRILDRAARDESEPIGSIYHQPLPVLAEWVQDLDAKDQWITRRRHVATSGVAWWREGGELRIALEAASIALSPRLHTSRADAGVGKTITFAMAILRPAEIDEMGAVWQALSPLFKPLTGEAWLCLRNALWDWMEPEALSPGLSAEGATAARDFARRVLADVAPDLAAQPALATDGCRLAAELGLSLDLARDPILDVLFPPAFTMTAVPALEELADRWVKEPPAEIAARIRSYEALARQVARTSGFALFELAKALAARAEDPTAWAGTLLEAGLRVEVIGPFLNRVAEKPSARGEQVLRRALAEPSVASWAAMTVLRSASHSGLVDLAVGVIESRSDLVETATLQGRLPSPVTRRLLGAADATLRHVTLTGVWNAEPQGAIPEELRAAWEGAVLTTTPEALSEDWRLRFWFPEILQSAPRLAECWLRRYARDLDVSHGSVVVAAVAALGPETRRQLVSDLLPDATFLLASLVREEPALYPLLLTRDPPAAEPLSPLAYPWQTDDPRWLALAREALKDAQLPRDVAAAVVGTYSHTGTGVDHWQRWENAFAAIARDASGALREAADHGRRMAAEKRVEAEHQDRRIALQGIR